MSNQQEYDPATAWPRVYGEAETLTAPKAFRLMADALERGEGKIEAQKWGRRFPLYADDLMHNGMQVIGGVVPYSELQLPAPVIAKPDPEVITLPFLEALDLLGFEELEIWHTGRIVVQYIDPVAGWRGTALSKAHPPLAQKLKLNIRHAIRYLRENGGGNHQAGGI